MESCMSNDWKERWLKKFLPSSKEKATQKLIGSSIVIENKKEVVDKPTFNLKFVESLLYTVNEMKGNRNAN